MAAATTQGAVRVRFVGDDDVIEHIYNISDASKRKKKVAVKEPVAEPSLTDESPLVAGVEREEAPIPVGLHATSDTLTGRQVFNLTCTPKAKHVVKAASRTPSREQRKGSCSTPKSPYSLRKKIKLKLSKMKNEAETCSGDSDSEHSSGEDEESDQTGLGKYSSYFTSNSRSKTSNHTLTKLGRPVMAPDEINSMLEKVNDPHVKHRAKLLSNYNSSFGHWLALLREGFTILLHGPGSKLKLLQKFKEAVLADFASITVNGFNPSLSYTEILHSILQCIPRGDAASSLGSALVINIVEHFSRNDVEDIFILINNIDGLGLRSAKVQEILSTLSTASHIHIIASVDHINAALLWNQETSRRFQFVWISATTFEPYALESSLEPLKSSASNALSSLKHVFCSLTPNARKIFLLVARHQLDNTESPSYAGMSFHDCYHRCREAFLVNSDLTLRAQLREFLDHMLLKIKKGHDGTENLLIPIEAVALALFLDQQEEEGAF
uniref:Origin recognition complex subunit 2 n=1 Tax=Rhipicephalus zambeziensis TaxID=60191 RepID=A0A224Z5P6_9ACAR